MKVWRQYSENDFAFGGRLDTRIVRIAHHITYLMARSHRNAGKRIATIISEILIDTPRSTEVVRPFDQHSCRSESLERDDQMGEVKLGFQVELNTDMFNAILCLPPGLLPFASDPLQFKTLQLCSL